MSTILKNEMDIQYGQHVNMVLVQCCRCGVPFAMPAELQQHFRDDPERYFSCPNGHQQHYSKSTEQSLREQLERQKKDAEQRIASLSQDSAFWLDYYTKAAEERNKVKKELAKVKKRVANGVCPCCNRTFQNLAEHMSTKHPEMKQEPKKRGRPRKNP